MMIACHVQMATTGARQQHNGADTESERPHCLYSSGFESGGCGPPCCPQGALKGNPKKCYYIIHYNYCLIVIITVISNIISYHCLPNKHIIHRIVYNATIYWDDLILKYKLLQIGQQ